MRTPGDVRRCLAAIANDMMRRKMDPTLGSKTAFVLSIILRSIENAEHRWGSETQVSPAVFAQRLRECMREANETIPGPPEAE